MYQMTFGSNVVTKTIDLWKMTIVNIFGVYFFL